MQKLLRQLARSVEALWDGEVLVARQLAELGERLALERLQNTQAFADFFASLAQPAGRLPVGELVVGADGDDEVNWPAAPRDVASVLLRHVAALASLRLILDDKTSVDKAAMFGLLGFDQSRARAFVQQSSIALADNMWLPPDIPAFDGPWHLLVTDSSPLIEMVAPFARDVAGNIDAYAGRLGVEVKGDDDRYRLIPQLMSENPQLLDERLRQEQGYGLLRPHAGLVVVDPAHIDLAAVDPRLRNAMTGLKRRATRVVICAAQSPALDAVLDAAQQAPQQCWLLAELPGGGDHVYSPRRMYSAGGHHIELNPAVAQILGETLDRELKIEEHPALFSCSAWPAWRHLQAMLGEEPQALDSQILGAAYRPALQLLWTEEDEGACWDWQQAPQLACVVCGPQAIIGAGLALWRALATHGRFGIGAK